MNLYEMLLPLGIMTAIGWIIRTIVVSRRLNNTARIQADLQSRLLEKFGTSQEMLGYLESPAGQRFVQSATIEKGNPHGRILGSVQAGVILTVLGVTLLLMRGQLEIEAITGMTLLGALGLALGIGFLVSAFAAYRMSKAWGLLGTLETDAGERS
jgi:hypothetical protein